MDKDRQAAREAAKSLPIGKKITHYLYYYRLHIIVTLVAIFLIGIYVYQRKNEVSYDLSISVYSDQYINADMEKNIEYIMSAWLNEGKNEELLPDIIAVSTPKVTLQTADKTSAAYTKLDGQLAAATIQAVIFDEYVYKTVMGYSEYSSVMMKEYSREIGENAKAKLGLSQDVKYYYLIRFLYDNEKDDDEAKARQKNAIKIYEKLKELQ